MTQDLRAKKRWTDGFRQSKVKNNEQQAKLKENQENLVLTKYLQHENTS